MQEVVLALRSCVFQLERATEERSYHLSFTGAKEVKAFIHMAEGPITEQAVFLLDSL